MQRRQKRPTRAELDAAFARFADLFRDWGSQGGKIGGKARWKGVSAEERRAHARKAARARWKKDKKKT
jgi:hypothetical protein